MGRRPKIIEPPMDHYIVYLEDDSVFSGMKNGYYSFSYDINEAKQLPLENTTLLLKDYPKAKLLKL